MMLLQALSDFWFRNFGPVPGSFHSFSILGFLDVLSRVFRLGAMDELQCFSEPRSSSLA